MLKREKIEYKINIIEELDLERMPKEEFDLLVQVYLDGLKGYLEEKVEKENSS